MANRWGNNEYSDRLHFGGSKITADGDCSHEIIRCLLLGRKAMMNLNSILKSRDITLLTKVRLVKATVFPVVMYGWESWTAEHRRIDAFELWCWRRLLRVPWTARRSNQSILKEIKSWVLRVELLSTEELMLLNCGVGEDSWTARRSNQSILKEIKSWVFIGRTDAEAETPILWLPYARNSLLEKTLCWKRLRAEEGDERGWVGWMASLT